MSNSEFPKFPKSVVATASFVTLLFYAAVVFAGQSALFGAYQFLRDRGYGFWMANLIITMIFTILAMPTIIRIMAGTGKRKQ